MNSDRIWLVAGLGNPGPKYAETRHNVGFMVVDELSRRLGGKATRSRFDSQIDEIGLPEGRLVLVKPQTYMNRSGFAVGAALRWYRVPLERTLVVYDDIDLAFGTIRLRPGGSSGGHNGLRSVIEQIGTDEIPRLRVGVGRSASGNAIGHVLSRFSTDESRLLPELIDAVVETVLVWQRTGIINAMNQCNRRLFQRLDTRNPA